MSDKPLEQSIFLTALELATPAEREAYLRDACGNNEALRAAVAELLAAHERAGNILDVPPVAAGGTMAQDNPGAGSLEQPGIVIGPYKLIEPIGEGGMGAVWMAQQTVPVKRLVAVKLIKAGMDSKQVIARFEAERQALALMDHPNIARVIDAGKTDAGRPYFVMDLVKGVPITRYCDEHHLTPRQRLELFLPVCQAVQHAHQKGVIHRDLKPSNVLVALSDGRPVPKVIDFGVAKAAGQPLTEKTLLTGLGNIVGTLEYMSPEQAQINQLDIDTRSDIYSLGVLLYELLAGGPPFSRKELEKAGLLEMLRVIREQEPSKPSTKLSAADGLPTLAANRGTEPAKLTKQVRGELDWIVMKALEKDRSRRYETANGFAQDVQRYLADEPVQACPPSTGYRLRKLLRRNKGPLSAAAVVFLALVAGVVGTTWGLLRAEAAWHDAVEARQAESERADGERRARQEVQARAAESEAVLGFVRERVFTAARPKYTSGGLGHDVQLRQALAAALPFVAQSFKDKPLIEARLRMTLGLSFSDLGEWKTAAEQQEIARALFTQHLGPDHSRTLRNAHNLANTYFELRRHDDALKVREETLARRKQKLGPDHPETLLSMNALALSYAAVRRHADAIKLYEEALALHKQKFGPDHHATLQNMGNLANSYAAVGRHDDALKVRQETLRLQKQQLGPDHLDTQMSMNNLAVSYADRGRYADAFRLFEETLGLRRQTLGADHPYTRRCMNNLAETLTLLKQKLGPDHPDTLRSMHHVALSYAALGRHADALKLHEETLTLRKQKLGPDHPDTLLSAGEVISALAALKRPDEALPRIDALLALAEQATLAGKLVAPDLALRMLSYRLRIHQDRHDAAGCRATAALWEQRKPADVSGMVNAARFRALTAAVQEENQAADAARLAREDADRAMAWLAQAVAAGFQDGASLEKERYFDSLRQREDFKRLLTELQAGKK
jgi:serine/threonine protein kinase/tetratricopeptide (TPR) repeat protein